MEVRMPTFVLKKYRETKSSSDTDNQLNSNKPNEEEEVEVTREDVPKDMVVTISGTVAEIVAQALHKALANKAEVTELEEDSNASTDVIAVSTEDINTSPLDTFNSISKNDIVFIHNQGFKTSQEEWFLTNVPNKTEHVFYTVESLVKYIQSKLEL